MNMPCSGGGSHSPLFPGAGRVISFLDSQTPRRNDQTEQNWGWKKKKKEATIARHSLAVQKQRF